MALAWIKSCLESCEYVYDEGGKPSVRSLTWGMPHSSVLGPILYVLNTTPVADIIKTHKVEYHFYADGNQLYVTFKCDSLENEYLVRIRVKHFVEDINLRMIKLSLLSQVQNTNQHLLLHQFKWERGPSTMCPLCVILVFRWIKLYPMMISANNYCAIVVCLRTLSVQLIFHNSFVLIR